MDLQIVVFFIIATLNLCRINSGYVLDALCDFCLFISLFSVAYGNLVDTSSPCPIYLTISPISQNVENSHLEVNWGPKCPNPAEWIGLYPEDPSISYSAPLFTVDLDNKTTGHVKTHVKLGDIELPYGWDRNDATHGTPDHIKSACLPFYIASFNGKRLQTLDCLKIQPNWMKSMPEIQNVPLKDLFIPGTHCSGCYDRRTKASRSILLKKFGFVQNFDIWTQLVFGTRYLDISVGYKDPKNETNSPSNLWIVNENLFVAPLLPLLEEIRLFVTLSKEIVILNFVDFPIGFYNYPERHLVLLRTLAAELGDIIFTRPWDWDNTASSGDLTIEMMDRTGKNLLILYNDKSVVEDSQLIWPSWRKFSTVNLQSNELSDYIRKIFSKKFENSPKNDPWVIYGIQGVDTSYSPGLHLPSSRERANAINKVFMDSISNAWAINANVVAFDFFMSCNLIDLAIGTNFQKHFNNTNYLILDIDE